MIQRYCGLANRFRIGAYGRASFTTTVVSSGVASDSTMRLVGLPKAFLFVFLGAVWKRSNDAFTSADVTAWPLTGGLFRNLAAGCSLKVTCRPPSSSSWDA